MQPARQYGQAVWLTALGNGGRLIGGNPVGQADEGGGMYRQAGCSGQPVTVGWTKVTHSKIWVIQER